MKNLTIIVFISILHSTAIAQDNTDDLSKLTNLLNTKINGASRFDQNLYEINGSANVIDFNNIRQFGFRNPAEALLSFAGNYLSYERDYRYMGVKGIARPGDFNSRILLLSDGIRLNDPLYDAALIGNESQIDIDWIKKIEFVSSPGSAQFGANAILGVANMVNFTGADIKGTQLKYTRESVQGNKLTVLHGNTFNEHDDYLFALTAYENPGGNFYMRQYDQAQNNDGVARGADDERYIKGYFKLAFDNWLLNAGISSRSKTLPTAYWESQFNSSNTVSRDNSYFINLTHQGNLAEHIQSKFRLRAGGYLYNGKFDNGFQPNQSESEWYGADYEIKLLHQAHQVALGIETQYNQQLRQKQAYLDIKEVDNHYLNYSLYAEDIWKISPSNSLQTGIRFDRINLRTAVSPKIALSHRFNETASIKFLYSRAFRAPNSYELLNTKENLLNRTFNSQVLNNEYIDSHEIIWQQVSSQYHVISANLFHRKIHDLIYQHIDEQQNYAFTNGNSTYTNGLSIESNYLTDDVSVRSNITLQKSTQDGNQITHSPNALAKFLATKHIPSINLDISLNLQYNARSRYHLQENTASYSISNLIFSTHEASKFGKGYIGVYNLFDKKYFTPASDAIRDSYLVQDGRQFRLYWEYGF